MSGWLWNRKPEPSPEEKAAVQTAKNAKTMQSLQDQYDDMMLMASNFGENVKRFDADAQKLRPGTPQRVHLETQKRSAFAAMQENKKQADVIWSQLQGLRRVTSNVQSMGTNIDLHERYKESNQVSDQIAGKLDVDAVNETMDAAHEHLTAHDEISEALAGRSMGGVVDQDEQDAEMAEFLGAHAAEQVPQVPRQLEVDDAARVSAYEDEVLRKLSVLATHKQPAAVPARGK